MSNEKSEYKSAERSQRLAEMNEAYEETVTKFREDLKSRGIVDPEKRLTYIFVENVMLAYTNPVMVASLVSFLLNRDMGEQELKEAGISEG